MKANKNWTIVLAFGMLQAMLTGFGTFFDLETGIGLYFVYVNSYFNTVIVLLPILLLGRFWVGTLVYLPWAVGGLFVEYYMEWIINPVLRSPWYVLAWCLLGLLIGFSADVSYRFIPSRNRLQRVVATGVIMNAVNFLLFAYVSPHFYIQTDPAALQKSLAGSCHYGVLWLLLNAVFGAYTALKVYEDTARRGSYIIRQPH